MQLAGYFLATATALAALAAGVKGLHYLGRFFIRSVRTLDSVSRVVPIWYRIGREFENNGGASLKDRIERIDQAVVNLSAGQAAQDQTLADHGSTLDGQNQVLAHIQNRFERLERRIRPGESAGDDSAGSVS